MSRVVYRSPASRRGEVTSNVSREGKCRSLKWRTHAVVECPIQDVLCRQSLNVVSRTVNRRRRLRVMSSWRRVVKVDTIRWSRLSTHWHRHRPHTTIYQFHTASTSTRRQRVRWATVVDRPTVVSISELRELSRPWPLVMSTAEELRLTVLVASRSPCRQVSHISPVFHRITLLVIMYLLHQHKINTNCTSSQVNPIFCMSLLTALLQFALGRPGPLLYPGTCQYNACCGMRWWSIQKTCPSQRSNCYYKSTALKRSTRQTDLSPNL